MTQRECLFKCPTCGGVGERILYPEGDMCPNCVTPWKCNGPHLPYCPDPFHVDTGKDTE